MIGLVDLEELQAVRGELLAQDRRNLEREAPLVFPDAAHQARQLGAAQSARRRAVEGVGSTGLMMFSLCVSRKCFSTASMVASRSGSGMFRQTYSVFQLWSSTHFLTTSSSRTMRTRDFVFLKGHPREAFGVQLAQLVLVVVMVGRAQNRRR